MSAHYAATNDKGATAVYEVLACAAADNMYVML